MLAADLSVCLNDTLKFSSPSVVCLSSFWFVNFCC